MAVGRRGITSPPGHHIDRARPLTVTRSGFESPVAELAAFRLYGRTITGLPNSTTLVDSRVQALPADSSVVPPGPRTRHCGPAAVLKRTETHPIRSARLESDHLTDRADRTDTTAATANKVWQGAEHAWSASCLTRATPARGTVEPLSCRGPGPCPPHAHITEIRGDAPCPPLRACPVGGGPQ